MSADMTHPLRRGDSGCCRFRVGPRVSSNTEQLAHVLNSRVFDNRMVVAGGDESEERLLLGHA